MGTYAILNTFVLKGDFCEPNYDAFYRHGKTTLLRHIACGALKIPAAIDVLYCEQEVTPDPESPVEVVLKADVKRTELLKECKELEEKSNTEVSGMIIISKTFCSHWVGFKLLVSYG
jgi:hypothetical protein